MFPIVKKRVLNPTVTLMEIEAPLVARKALPGQFIIFRIDEEGERIPLTIAGYDRERGTVTIIFQKVGYTTEKLDTLNEGDALLDFVGPLGEPSHTEGVKRAAVIGGGLGVAIAYPQAKALHEAGCEVDLIVGFRNEDLIILQDELTAACTELTVMTDDGSNGHKGFVTQALAAKLESGVKYDEVIAIGPLPMMKFVSLLTKKYNIKLANIPELSEKITGGVATIAFGVILFSVVKSFALVFPPSVIFAICGYLMPNYFLALLINIVSVFLSLSIPYFLGRFTGASMVDTLKGKFKAIKKMDDFAGANEMEMTFAIKLSGLLPGDLSSLLFGAMGISYKNYMIGANLGMLPLAIVYTLFGTALKSIGEKPWLAAIPVVVIIVFVLIASLITKRLIAKTKAAQEGKKNG